MQSDVPQARNDETPRPHGDIQRTQQEENEEEVGEEGQPLAVPLSEDNFVVINDNVT